VSDFQTDPPDRLSCMMTLDEDHSRGRSELYGADTVKAGEEALALDVE